MKLSIVATLYQSELYIKEFHERSSTIAKKLVGDDYEIILVNDGSPDNSLDVAVQLSELDYHVVIVDLSRNFGHHKAMMTGLAYAKGERIFLIDTDLEEEPEWIESFAQQMNEDKSDVIYGVQTIRKGGIFERLTGWLFYRIYRLLNGIEQPDNIVTARLMTSRYVNALTAHTERELNIGSLWITTGFKQSAQKVSKHATSPTTYTLAKKFSHMVNAVTSFSSVPLVFTFYAGLFLSFSSLIFIFYNIFRYFFISSLPRGYTSIIASVWFFSGLIIFFIGIQGIYIAKVFSDVKQRPYTVVRHVYESSQRNMK